MLFPLFFVLLVNKVYCYIPNTNFKANYDNRKVKLHRLNSNTNNEQTASKIMAERLRAEAASLRAEAEVLEAEQKVLDAAKLSMIFDEFDLNNDGEISVEELKLGLEKTLRLDINEDVIVKVMKAFDDSGDGALQLDEFKGITAFKNKIDAIINGEKRDAEIAAIKAREEVQKAKAKERTTQKIAELLNNAPPSMNDRIASLLPYLFPLADSLDYGKYLLTNNANESPIAGFAVIIGKLYGSIPFAGLIAFFALASLGSNLKLNRLIRFNIQQAIFLDIALIAPGFLGGIVTISAPNAISPSIVEMSSTAVFVTFGVAILYSCASSLLGVTPNAIPFISKKAEDRLPSNQQLEKFFDADGNIKTAEILMQEEEQQKLEAEKEKESKESGIEDTEIETNDVDYKDEN